MSDTVVPFAGPLVRPSDVRPSDAKLRAGFWGRRGAVERAQVHWLWQGYLAARHVTLLTALWKSGKTTLTSILLDRLKAGGQLAGLPVTAAKAVLRPEASRAPWEATLRK